MMTSRSISLFLILLLKSVLIIAQSVTGRIHDPMGGPLGNVVVLVKRDTSLIKVDFTDEKGYFDISLSKEGIYCLHFSGMGLKVKDTCVRVLKAVSLNIVMSPMPKELTEVYVQGRRPLVERKIDRFVFNVDKNIYTVGKDAFDILTEAPMVKVSEGGAISLNGKGGVRLMVDDKMIYLSGAALAAFLRTIPAETIDRIEMITNPSARYDADVVGLVNIVRKKNKNIGFSGSANGNMDAGTYLSGGGSVVVNYNTKRLRWVANVGFKEGATETATEQDYYYSSQSWIDSWISKNGSQSLNASVGMETDLSNKTLLGVSFHGILSNPVTRGNWADQIVDQQGILDSTVTSSSYADDRYHSTSANLHVGHQIDTSGRKLAVDFDWINGKDNSSTSTQSSNHFPSGAETPYSSIFQTSVEDLRSNVYSLNAVVDWPARKIIYAFGSKLSYLSSYSECGLFSGAQDPPPLVAPLDEFRYQEGIEALFGTADTHIRKWEMQAGLRSEYTQTRAFSPVLDSTYVRSYLNLFPSIFISWSPNKDHVLNGSYARRISRPDIRNLDPYPVYTDPYDYSVGNPNLRPTISNDFELSETFGNALILTAAYSYAPGKISGYTLAENGSNKRIGLNGNFLTTRDYSLSGTFSYNKIAWLFCRLSANLYYQKDVSQDTATVSELSGWGGDLNYSNTFYLTKSKSVSAGFSAIVQFPYVSDLTIGGQHHSFNLFANWTGIQSRLRLGLWVSDIFKTYNATFTESINSIREYTKINNDSRRVGMTVKYRFGSSKMKRGATYSGVGAEGGRAN
jgi:outer membrane receptor protein involved in Fe transport